jgi:tRNA pseudouridine55 synthase
MGFIVIDKPEGITSFDVIRVLRKILGIKKIGHAGTLDPFAQGVLVIAVGQGTKFIRFFLESEKEYIFDITFGEERDTLDREGKIIDKKDVFPMKEDIDNILSHFTGTIEQTPPIYSALKIKGQPAYKLARKNEPITMPSRLVSIKELSLIHYGLKKSRFRVVCSSGTYVRSLARDIAHFLKTFGYVSYLRRTRVGKMNEKNAFSLEKIQSLYDNNQVKTFLLPLETMLDDILALAVSDKEHAKWLLQGKSVPIHTLLPHRFIDKSGEIFITYSGKIIGIGLVKDAVLFPKKMIQKEKEGDLYDVD